MTREQAQHLLKDRMLTEHDRERYTSVPPLPRCRTR
jgi:hypothetical protein